MSNSRSAHQLPDSLASTHALIQRAYPNGVPEEAYLPLLSILTEEMSNRSVARVVSHFTGREYPVAFNDVLRAQSTDVPTQEATERVKQHLTACGYPEWLAEPAWQSARQRQPTDGES